MTRLRTEILTVVVVGLLSVALGLLVARAADEDLDLPVNPLDLVHSAPKSPVVAQIPPVPPLPAPPVQPVPTIPPPTIYGHDLRSENATVVYVLDCSGSMTLDQGQYVTPDGQFNLGNRLDRAKGALVSSIRSLPETWQFDILTYQCDMTMWRTQLVRALPSAKAAAESWIAQDVFAGGATGTGPACAEVFNTWADVKLVVLLTDGAPNCGAGNDSGDSSCIAAHRVMVRGNNRNRATINVFGIGATGDFKQFCEDIACDSGGTYTDVR